MRILLADDHAITREGTRRLLEAEADLDVIAEAADGEEAVRLVEALHPDILLLDISMPRLNGVQVVKELAESAPQTHIVVLTGYDNEHYLEALTRLGVRGYLPKSASSRELVSALRAVYAGESYLKSDITGGASDVGGLAPAGKPTPRELEVLRLVAQGASNHDIALRLSMSQRTVQFHLSRLFAKLDARSRTQVAHLARQRGWIL
ncbi:MAG TPA: response regulator transcription factor [Chloroflexota bacterium]